LRAAAHPRAAAAPRKQLSHKRRALAARERAINRGFRYLGAIVCFLGLWLLYAVGLLDAVPSPLPP
jgi:hypothetical protein